MGFSWLTWSYIPQKKLSILNSGRLLFSTFTSFFATSRFFLWTCVCTCSVQEETEMPTSKLHSGLMLVAWRHESGEFFRPQSGCRLPLPGCQIKSWFQIYQQQRRGEKKEQWLMSFIAALRCWKWLYCDLHFLLLRHIHDLYHTTAFTLCIVFSFLPNGVFIQKPARTVK